MFFSQRWSSHKDDIGSEWAEKAEQAKKNKCIGLKCWKPEKGTIESFSQLFARYKVVLW